MRVEISHLKNGSGSSTTILTGANVIDIVPSNNIRERRTQEKGVVRTSCSVLDRNCRTYGREGYLYRTRDANLVNRLSYTP
jgi:hypothetical protein